MPNNVLIQAKDISFGISFYQIIPSN